MINSSDLVNGAQFIGDKKPKEGQEQIVLTFDSFNRFGDCNFIPSDENMKDDEGFFFLPIHASIRFLSKYEK